MNIARCRLIDLPSKPGRFLLLLFQSPDLRDHRHFLSVTSGLAPVRRSSTQKNPAQVTANLRFLRVETRLDNPTPAFILLRRSLPLFQGDFSRRIVAFVSISWFFPVAGWPGFQGVCSNVEGEFTCSFSASVTRRSTPGGRRTFGSGVLAASFPPSAP
jgi:hypothetical protein